MGLFDGIFSVQSTPGMRNPTTPGGNFVEMPTAAPTTGMSPMALASILGMMGGAIGGPNSWQGRLGSGVQQVANTQLSAEAMIKQQEGDRKFFSDLLKAHSQSKMGAFGSQTPQQTGGISGMMGGLGG